MKKSFGMYFATSAGGVKFALLQAFGIPIVHDKAFDYIPHEAYNLLNPLTDFAFSFSANWKGVHSFPTSTRGVLRRAITNVYDGGNIFYTDVDPLNNYRPQNDAIKIRIAFKSIWPNEANYFVEDVDNVRWQKLAKDRNIDLKEYNTNGDFIYLCCNRGSGGYSARNLNAADWAIQTASEIRKYTDRPIVIRQHKAIVSTHESDYKKLCEFSKNTKSITIESPGTRSYKNIIDQTRLAHSVVTHTSTAGAPAIIEGKPLYVTGEWGYLYKMHSGSFANIESPDLNLHDKRQQFLNEYSYSHYNAAELAAGEYWTRVRKKLLELP